MNTYVERPFLLPLHPDLFTTFKKYKTINIFIMDNLPKDPNILMSFINTKLRDEFRTLDDLCLSLDIDKNELLKKLAEAGFEYNAPLNKFW